MNSNELSLDVAKSHSLKTMRIIDTSHYSGEGSLENYMIEILPVNKKEWIPFYVHKGFNLVVNSSSLHYKKITCPEDELVDIPDGIYEFKQSYKPNSGTLVHFMHLRVVALNLKYVELLCNHFSAKCETTATEYERDSNKLTKIGQYITAAEYSVSEKHNKQQGIDFYNKAVALIDEFEKYCGCK